MSAIISNTSRAFSVNAFMSILDQRVYKTWTNNQSYVIGDIRLNGTYKYVAVSSGTSGIISPTHTVGTQSDGGVNWAYVETVQSQGQFGNSLYVGIGKTSEWPVEASPELPLDTDDYFTDTLREAIAVKRVVSSSLSFGIVRHDWISGMQVSQYSPTVSADAYPFPFYVYTDDGNIYKCLNNKNGTPSTSKPTGTGIAPIITTDGLVWKYMYSVSGSDATMFSTTAFIPAHVQTTDDGSPQWNAQENAVAGSLSTITVTDGGLGYTNATVTISSSTGVTATASAVIEGGVITAINLNNIGAGYITEPTVTITGNGSGASAVAVLAPIEGHGSNVCKELNARYVILNARFEGDEDGYFTLNVGDGFRQLFVVLDPQTITGAVASDTRYIGPASPNYSGDGTNGYLELKSGTGSILYLENMVKIVRTDTQIEEIKIILRF